MGLREVASLSKLKHDTIVRLKELVHEAGVLWFVFEYVATNLYLRIQDSTVVFDDNRIRLVMYVATPRSPPYSRAPTQCTLLPSERAVRWRRVLTACVRLRGSVEHACTTGGSCWRVCITCTSTGSSTEISNQRSTCLTPRLPLPSRAHATVPALTHAFRFCPPHSILCNDDVVKIADFGLARETRSRPPYTEYVSTRW